jgi:AraC-like DNA-binding protein/quercetin dioxygenase-like cupin family protein
MEVASTAWSAVTVRPMVVGPLVDEDGVLLWVHTGTATVEAGGTTHELQSGTAIWIPAGIEHATRTAAGAVVFPLRLPTGQRPLAVGEPRVVAIPSGWEDWLIYQWDDNSSTRDATPRAEALVDLVARTPPTGQRRSGDRTLPRMPRSREAAGVARAILRLPGSPRTVESFADRERISAKTLQRQFLRETGLTFSAWRTRARVAVAVRRLDDGRGIGETGREVGYATPSGFTRAFRTITGLSPSEYVARRGPAGEVAATAPHGDPTTAFTADPPPAAPPIPARTFWEKVHDHHELMWVHRGTATIRIGGRERALREGDALWVPAGLTHTVIMDAESLMLTAGLAHGRFRIGVDDIIVFTFPRDAEAVLLHTMISEFTLFRPDVDAGALVRTLFHEQFLVAQPGVGGPTGALGEIATALRRDPADARSLAEWAAHLRTTPRHLGREILSQSGETFPRWRSRIRMDIARDLLRAGDPPGQVFGRLGYASASAFSRAFATAHGITARDYQRREDRQTVARTPSP